MSNLPEFTIRELLEAGVHYGHKTFRWNPRMAPYLYGHRNGTHIIDLQKTAPLLHNAIKTVFEVVRNNGRVLFVGTKRQASDVLAEAAERCGQYYVNHRWLGGMLTNWKTISRSINTLRDTEEALQGDLKGYKKKEILNLERKAHKIRRSLGGIMEMGGKPDLLVIIDTNKESNALEEAKHLGVPIIGILDSNSNPEHVDFPVPGNDDAQRAIELYCRLFADAALAGIEQSLAPKVVKTGESKAAQEEAPKVKKKAVTVDVKKETAAKKAPAKAVVAQEESQAQGAAEEVEKEERKEAKKPAAKKAPAKKVAAKEEKSEEKPAKPAAEKEAQKDDAKAEKAKAEEAPKEKKTA